MLKLCGLEKRADSCQLEFKMAYTRNIPTASQFQSVSQPIIRDNFNSSDDAFNIDHYGFSDTTSNIGLHRQVTTTDRGSHPSSPLTNPTLYAKSEGTTNLGTLQYSKGPNRLDQGNQVSSPITFIQSSETAITINNLANVDVLDFDKITRAFATLYMGNFSNGTAQYLNVASILYVNSAKFVIVNNNGTSNNLVAANSGSILKIVNATGGQRTQVYWTLQFLRIEI